MGPKTSELIQEMTMLEDLLKRYQENHWASYMSNAKKLIVKGDFRGVEIVENSFGGMGSFNDLILHQMNKHKITNQETEYANDTLSELRSKIYDLVIEISKNSIITNK